MPATTLWKDCEPATALADIQGVVDEISKQLKVKVTLTAIAVPFDDSEAMGIPGDHLEGGGIERMKELAGISHKP